MAVLKAVCGPDRGSFYHLDQTPCRMGRAADCDIRDVFHGFSIVSRHHAVIEKRDGDFFVRDTGSHNGTFVNDSRVTRATQVRNGDRLSIGGLIFVFLQSIPEPDGPSYVFDSESETTVPLTIDVCLSDQRRDFEADAKLCAMLDMLAGLGSSLDVKDVMNRALKTLLEIFDQADEAFVGLGIPAEDPPALAAVFTRNSTEDRRVHLNRKVIEFAARSKQAVLSDDAVSDPRFGESDSTHTQPIRSLMCAPVLDAEERCAGILQLNNLDPSRPFQDSDLEVLVAVSALISVAIQYSRLHEAALQKQALDQDLAAARLIQQNLLPADRPELPNYTLDQFYRPARQIGGDYYDYLPLPDGRLAVLVADACGKGVAAAILISIVSGELKSSLAGRLSPAAALDRVNARLVGAECDSRFVTLSMVVIDPASGDFEILNAGHFEPMVRRRHGAVDSAGAGVRQFPLGIESNVRYTSATSRLQPGESVIMFSDGITDAMASSSECYGLPRLLAAAESMEHADAHGLVRRIVDDVVGFMGSHPQVDDMCLVCLQRSQPS